jgi:hypothetical protein
MYEAAVVVAYEVGNVIVLLWTCMEFGGCLNLASFSLWAGGA